MIENLIIIGSAGKNCGKTAMAEELIRTLAGHVPVYALKVTSVAEKHGTCVRGGAGCGACTNIHKDFVLTEELVSGEEKDTQRLLAAGADKVFWLRSLREHLTEAFDAFTQKVPDGAMIVCESNSLREYVTPARFVMMRGAADEAVKPSAAKVAHLADITIRNTFDRETLAAEAASIIQAVFGNPIIR